MVGGVDAPGAGSCGVASDGVGLGGSVGLTAGSMLAGLAAVWEGATAAVDSPGLWCGAASQATAIQTIAARAKRVRARTL